MEKAFKIKVECTQTGKIYEAECDHMILHVANKLERGLLETHSFIPSEDSEEDFRMYLSLGRALQDLNFGHIHEDVGTIQPKTNIIKEVK